MSTDCSRWGPVDITKADGSLEMRSEDGVVRICGVPSIELNGQKKLLEDAAELTGGGTVAAGAEIRLAGTFDAPSVEWTISLSLSEDGETVLLSSEIANASDEVVKVGRCSLVDVAPGWGWVEMEGEDGDAVFLKHTGTTGHCNVFRMADNEGAGMSRTIMHIASKGAGKALHFGFVTYDRITTFHEFTYDAGIRSLACVSDFEGYELRPGQIVASETLMIEARPDVHVSLENWADRVAAHYKPTIWPKIPGGWLGWAWVDAFNSELYEDVVLRNVKAIRERLPECDIEHVWVSIGNIKDGMPGDWLSWDYGNFPNGAKHLTGELSKLGFKLGFWCGAFWMSSHLEDTVEKMKDAMLKLDGEPVVALARWNYGASALMDLEDRPCMYSLDPTHPMTEEFIRNVFETYREWGLGYYMVDFINAIAGSTEGAAYDDYHDRSLIKGPQVLRKGLEIVRKAAGPDTYLLSSSGPDLQNVGLVDACRVGNDYGEGRAIAKDSYFYPATFVINAADFWTSHRHASDNMAANYFTHRKLYINDSGNVMTVDKPIPVCEAQITATIFGLCGGPVMLGDDIDRISEERLALIKKVFPRTPQVALPVDLFDCPAPDYPKVFHQRVEAGWGDWDIVGVLNYGAETLEQSIDLARLKLDPEGHYRLWEFWNEQYLGEITGELEAIVPPRSARLFKLIPVMDHPWVISTDMHTQQGQVELADVEWNAETMTLSGKATRPAGETGNVFFIAPKGLRVAHPQGWWIAKDARNENLIIRGQFEFGDKPVEWAIQFAQVD